MDVLLVVTRWHGGVPLGPDRFKMIAMVRCGIPRRWLGRIRRGFGVTDVDDDVLGLVQVAKEALELSGFAK